MKKREQKMRALTACTVRAINPADAKQLHAHISLHAPLDAVNARTADEGGSMSAASRTLRPRSAWSPCPMSSSLQHCAAGLEHSSGRASKAAKKKKDKAKPRWSRARNQARQWRACGCGATSSSQSKNKRMLVHRATTSASNASTATTATRMMMSLGRRCWIMPSSRNESMEARAVSSSER